jgi:hypothetical protein
MEEDLPIIYDLLRKQLEAGRPILVWNGPAAAVDPLGYLGKLNSLHYYPASDTIDLDTVKNHGLGGAISRLLDPQVMSRWTLKRAAGAWDLYVYL